MEMLRQMGNRWQSDAARLAEMFHESGSYALQVKHNAQTVAERARVQMANMHLPDIGPRYRR